MKARIRFPWYLTWGLMLVAALGVGLVTRLSYADVSAHPEELYGMTYQVAPFSTEEFNRYAEGVGDPGTKRALMDAEAVVRVRRKGLPVYRYKAFTTNVHIDEVLRGDEALAGTSINVYEPVSMNKRGSEKVLTAADAYQFGSVPMRDDDEYILFLNSAPKNRVVGDAWTLAVSPFSKLVVNGSPRCVVHSGLDGGLRRADLLDADMVAESREDRDAYLRECADVVRGLGMNDEN
ncbi:MAG: hypothetical protein Q4B77_02630 [Coriobacteriaceae bacterium]|nr:hypothetical protein [Coriobacteriaceae bacterium]